METREQYILRRKELIRNLQAPIISEAKFNLGDFLSDVIFCTCEEALKTRFGLTPYLEGPGDELWISPSDLLKGKVCLKPPLTSKHIQALTHYGILEIGLDIEKKVWNEQEMIKEKELQEQEKVLKILFEVEKEKLSSQIREDERELCRQEKHALNEEWHAKLLEELAMLEVQLKNQFELQMEQKLMEVGMMWQEKMDAAIKQTTEDMTRLMEENLHLQEMTLSRTFNHALSKLEMESKFAIESEQTICEEKLQSLRHQLECTNISNMMYVICMERHKCKAEIKLIKDDSDKKMGELGDKMREMTDGLTALRKEKDQKEREVTLREQCLLEILKQFQKFINFALKSCPTQAEFLLCLEKMMVFELTDVLDRIDKPKPGHPDEPILWEHTPRSSEDSKKEDSLFARDHHECLNEPDLPISDQELSSGDDLPAFHYNNQTYVREDFRNMISQGVEIDPLGDLWSKDVEMLVNLLKTCTHLPCIKPREAQSVCSAESVDHMLKEKLRAPPPQKIDQKISDFSQTSVHFTPSQSPKKKTSLTSHHRKHSILRDPTGEIEAIDFKLIGSEENKKNLLATKNSVELIKEIKMNKAGSSPKLASEDVTVEVIELEEEKEITPTFMTPGIATPSEMESLVGTEIADVLTPSRLMLAKDSLILKKTLEAKPPDRRSSIKPVQGPSPVPFDPIFMMDFSQTLTPSLDLKCSSTASKLSMAKDSLTLLKEKGKKKEPSYHKRKSPVQSVEIIDGIVAGQQKIFEESEAEVFSARRRSSVAFKGKGEVIGLKQIYSSHTGLDAKPSSADQIKPKEKFKRRKPPKTIIKPFRGIVGDRDLLAGLQEPNVFTADRINSFVSIIKDHPNLLRTFTACTR